MNGQIGLEELIGEESEAPEPVASAPIAKPIALAATMDTSKHDPELSRKAGSDLDEQLSLVRLQIRHVDADQRLAIGRWPLGIGCVSDQLEPANGRPHRTRSP